MKKIYKTIIVDDEDLAREELKELLSEFNFIQIVGEADSVKSAKELIDKINPDLIFLDIQMPRATGFDLLNQIETEAEIIFVTAYDNFAIRAFEINALDYLIKPVYPERLAESISRIEHQQKNSDKSSQYTYDDSVFVKSGHKANFIKIKDILCINSAKEYSEIVTSTGIKTLVFRPMHEWESMLPEKHFIRIHRSSIINLNFIDSMHESSSNRFKVFLQGKTEPIFMSQRYYAKIKRNFP